MRVDEILIVPSQNFDKNEVAKRLIGSSKQDEPFPYDSSNFDINTQSDGNNIIIILTDKNEIVAYAGFEILTASLWQGRNIQVYEPYMGRNLAAKLIKFVKDDVGVNIQSDIRQSEDGKKLWTKKLQTVGIYPKIFDTETNHIIDKKVNRPAYEVALSKMYTKDPLDPEKFKYTWIIEHSDQYPEQNILKESSLLLPLRGLWYNFEKERNELRNNQTDNSLNEFMKISDEIISSRQQRREKRNKK